ncbi:hypothetical protein EBS80_03990 [bacterium]|nr:hypothetical protein [bacterium]
MSMRCVTTYQEEREMRETTQRESAERRTLRSASESTRGSCFHCCQDGSPAFLVADKTCRNARSFGEASFLNGFSTVEVEK